MPGKTPTSVSPNSAKGTCWQTLTKGPHWVHTGASFRMNQTPSCLASAFSNEGFCTLSNPHLSPHWHRSPSHTTSAGDQTLSQFNCTCAVEICCLLGFSTGELYWETFGKWTKWTITSWDQFESFQAKLAITRYWQSWAICDSAQGAAT